MWQFAHFVEETAPALLVVDAGPADNPWLAQVVPLALAENSKGSLSHGLLRSAILSLSLAHMSLQPGGSSDSSTNDRLLAHSNESKRQIMSQLEALETLDMFEDGGVDLDALLATVWAITARDVRPASANRVFAEYIASGGIGRLGSSIGMGDPPSRKIRRPNHVLGNPAYGPDQIVGRAAGHSRSDGYVSAGRSSVDSDQQRVSPRCGRQKC